MDLPYPSYPSNDVRAYLFNANAMSPRGVVAGTSGALT